MLRMLSSLCPQLGSRVLFLALVLFGGGLIAAAAPPAQEKSDAKESPASFRAYLPTIRLKALRDNERQSVADLEKWLQRYERYLQGGLVNLLQRGQIEEEYHRSRLRVLRLDADYRDSLDLFTSRFRDSAKRRGEMEDAAISSVVKVIHRFEELSHDYETVLLELDEIKAAKDVVKLRPASIKILTESPLVKNTALPKRFLKSWDEWKKIDDRSKLMERILKDRRDLAQIRSRTVIAKEQPELPNADRERVKILRFETDLGDFQLALLSYEKQPWQNIKDVDEPLQSSKRSQRRRDAQGDRSGYSDHSRLRIHRTARSYVPVLARPGSVAGQRPGPAFLRAGQSRGNNGIAVESS